MAQTEMGSGSILRLNGLFLNEVAHFVTKLLILRQQGIFEMKMLILG